MKSSHWFDKVTTIQKTKDLTQKTLIKGHKNTLIF